MFQNVAVVIKVITNKLQHGNFSLNNYVGKPLETNGTMGEFEILTCNITDYTNGKSSEYSFFVKKKSPLSEELTHEICDNVFGKEVATFHMFNTINIPILNAAIPKCFYNENQQLIFEYLNAKDYQNQTSYRVATEDEIHVVLKALAGIHAAGIIYEEQETAKYPDKKLVRLNNVFPEAFLEVYAKPGDQHCLKHGTAVMKGLQTAIDVFNLPKVLKTGKVLKEEILSFWDLFDTIKGIKPSKKYRNTMCHSDLWAANIFIKYNEDGKAEKGKLIDFQIERYLPPAFDVLDYILLNTTREYRKKNLHNLKVLYYNLFSKNLEEYGINPLDIYTLQEFLDSFKEIEMLGIYLVLHTIPLVYNSERSISDVANSEQYAKILLEDRSPLFTNFTSNDYFLSRVKDSLLDMVEFFENN